MKRLDLGRLVSIVAGRIFSRRSYQDILAIVILFFWSGVFVFWQWGHTPHALALDELEFAKLALMLDRLPFPTFFSGFATGHSTLYFYIINIFFKIFGFSNQTLRLPSALASMVSVVVFYLILKKLSWSLRYALFAGLMLASMRWFYQFGRFAFEGTFLIFLELTTLCFLVGFLSGKKWKDLILVTISSVACFYSYTPGRLFFLVPLLLIAIEKDFSSKFKVKASLVFLTTFVFLISPLLVQIRQVGDERVSTLSIIGRNDISIGQKVMHLWVNGGKSALMWHVRGDTNARHNYFGKPALNRMTGILFLVGLLVFLREGRNRENDIWGVWFLVGLIPSLLVTPADNPHFLRALPLVVPTVIWIAKGYIWSEENIEDIAKRARIKPAWSSLGLVLVFFAIVIINAIWDGRTYFKFQKLTHRDAFRIRLELSDFEGKLLPPTNAMITEFFEMYGDE